jgi:hypothetical protein
MKNYRFKFTVMVIMIILAGCTGRFYNKVITYDDEFRNNSKRITRVSLRSEEKRTEVNNAKIVFEREFSSGQGEGSPKAYFVISRSSASFRIDRIGFMKCGGQKFELTVVEPISEYKTEYETTAMSTESSDSTGYSSFQMSDTNSSQWFDEKFVIDITPDMASGIRESDGVTFRFYFGPIPATYILDGKRLEAVKGVLR